MADFSALVANYLSFLPPEMQAALSDELSTVDSAGEIPSTLILSGDITPAALGAGPTENYAPTGFADATVIRQEMSVSGSLGGLAGGAGGRVIVLRNIVGAGGAPLTLVHEDAGSSAINRFALPEAVNFSVVVGGSATLQYDGTLNRWTMTAFSDAPGTVSGNLSVPGNTTLGGSLTLTGDISPAALASGTTNDYAPAGLADASVLRVSADVTGSALSGLAGGSDGKIISIFNVSGGVLTLLDDDSGSAPGNKFSLLGDLAVPVDSSVRLMYDATSASWRQESSAVSISMPTPTITYRPGATGANAPGGSVFTTWAEVQVALDNTKYLGLRLLNFDNSFAPASTTGVPAAGGKNPAPIPSGGWDMTQVVWTAQDFLGGGQNRAIEFLDGCQISNFYTSSTSVSTWWFNGTSGTPVFSFDGNILTINNALWTATNNNAAATPMFKITGTSGLILLNNAWNNFGGGLASVSVPDAPVFDVNGGSFTTLQNGGMWPNGFFTGAGTIRIRNKAPTSDGQLNGQFGISADYTWSQPAFTGTFFVTNEYVDLKTVTANISSPGGSAQIGQFVKANTVVGAGNPIAIAAPNAIVQRAGGYFTVKDTGGFASTNNVTVTVPAGEFMDGVLDGTYVINTDRGSRSFMMDSAGRWESY